MDAGFFSVKAGADRINKWRLREPHDTAEESKSMPYGTPPAAPRSDPLEVLDGSGIFIPEMAYFFDNR